MSEGTTGVIVIGAGRYGFRAHFPAISAGVKDKSLKLIAVVDFERQFDGGVAFEDEPERYVYEKHRKQLRDFLDKTPPVVENLFALDAWRTHDTPPTSERIGARLDSTIKPAITDSGCRQTAVVVSTWPTMHKPYVKWALERGYHVLVDKPLTVPNRCAVEDHQAAQILKDYKELVSLAKEQGCLFMLATQKRYSSVFSELAERIAKVAIGGRQVPITSLTYETNDGYWLFAEDGYTKWVGAYGTSQWGYRPESGAGKVSHTGYHILDIIPWLIRHGGAADINNAVVYSSFWRPIDSFTTLRLQRDGTGRLSVRPAIEDTDILQRLQDLSEVNAQVQIAFRHGNEKRCQIMINFLHEGISGPGEGSAARIKYEQMNLHQGPAAAACFRRVSQLGRGELTFFRNTSILTDGVAVELVPITEEDDTLPAKEFFRTIATKNSCEWSQVVSPLSDHEIGIRLMEAVYRSGISERPYSVQLDSSADLWKSPILYDHTK